MNRPRAPFSRGPWSAGLIALLICVPCACQNSSRHSSSHAPLLSRNKEQLYQNFDSEVIITGKALTVPKEGVVVAMDDGTHVMIPELPEWPRRAAGQRVSVTGMLQRVPAAVMASSGDVTPKPDDRFLLKGVRWKLGQATTRP